MEGIMVEKYSVLRRICIVELERSSDSLKNKIMDESKPGLKLIDLFREKALHWKEV